MKSPVPQASVSRLALLQRPAGASEHGASGQSSQCAAGERCRAYLLSPRLCSPFVFLAEQSLTLVPSPVTSLLCQLY